MNEQAIKDVTAWRLEAQSLRRDARKPTLTDEERKNLLGSAAAALSRAISTLKRELRAVGKQADNKSSDGTKLRELLSQTFGSLGGTYRDGKDYEQALQAYKDGNEIEAKRRTEDGQRDSYNLVQQVVVWLLMNPAELQSTECKAELDAVQKELDRQFVLGRRDSWALADAVLIRFLRGEEAEAILSDLESRKLETSFYESNYEVISRLLEEGLGRETPLEKRLEEFRRLLQRRGGLMPTV